MMKRILLFSMCLISGITFSVFAQDSQPEEISITTYYPSPFGSYNELEINRSITYKPVNKDDLPGGPPQDGELIYNIDKKFYYYKAGEGWKPLEGSPEAVAIWENKSFERIRAPVYQGSSLPPFPSQTVSSSIPEGAEILTCSIQRHSRSVMYSSFCPTTEPYGALIISGPSGFSLGLNHNERDDKGNAIYYKSKTANISTGGDITATCTGFAVWWDGESAHYPPENTTNCNLSCYYIKKK